MEVGSMKNNHWWLLLCVLFLVFSSFLAACGRGEESSSEVEKPSPATPVTLTVAGPKYFTDEEYQKYVSEPVRKKYPHITMKQIDTTEKGLDIASLVGANQIPDIIAFQQGNMGPLFDLRLMFDTKELAKKHKFDLSRLQPELLKGLQAQYGTDMLPGLPIYQSTYVMAYNKTIFDRFGVAYPKDGMFWEDVFAMAQNLTRIDQGIQYYGVSMARTYHDGYKPISLPFADFSTNKPLFQSQGWKDQFALWNDLYAKLGSPPKIDWEKAWSQEKRVGMRIIQTALFQTFLADKGLVWDIVTHPQNKKAPGIGLEMNAHWWSISSTSQHKDAAYQVISLLLSDEVQTKLSRGMRISVLNDNDIQNQVGADLAGAQAMNLKAFVKLKNPIPIRLGTLGSAFYNNMVSAYESVFYDGKDINTALREADEKMAKDIQASLQK
jgi:multiple sugar transport system substrate-binding protein